MVRRLWEHFWRLCHVEPLAGRVAGPNARIGVPERGRTWDSVKRRELPADGRWRPGNGGMDGFGGRWGNGKSARRKENNWPGLATFEVRPQRDGSIWWAPRRLAQNILSRSYVRTASSQSRARMNQPLSARWRPNIPPSFIAQRHDRVHSHGTACRNIGCQERN